jgi:hypothetical protein
MNKSVTDFQYLFVCLIVSFLSFFIQLKVKSFIAFILYFPWWQHTHTQTRALERHQGVFLITDMARPSVRDNLLQKNPEMSPSQYYIPVTNEFHILLLFIAMSLYFVFYNLKISNIRDGWKSESFFLSFFQWKWFI